MNQILDLEIEVSWKVLCKVHFYVSEIKSSKSTYNKFIVKNYFLSWR